MPIADVAGYDPGHFGRVYEHILKPAIEDAGFTPIRADDTAKTDYIVVGVVQNVNAELVLCDYSSRNPNVMYELGIRHAFNRPVVLVKDIKTEKVFDIQGLRYIEYDCSLRIDSVRKDVTRITTAIKETAAGHENGFNSVVSLAGLKVAEVPKQREVSPDTQLLLSAIGAVQSRLDSIDTRARPAHRFFRVDGERIVFLDGTRAEIGTEVYEEGGKELGCIIDIHPAEERIFLRQKDGKVVPYSALSIKSKGLTSIPF